MNISSKVYQETQHFIEKVEQHGFDPISAFYAMFPRIMKEVEHETVHLAFCSHFVWLFGAIYLIYFHNKKILKRTKA